MTKPAVNLEPALKWFAARGWTPFEFQREAWMSYLGGESGLVNAPTGTGKTLAVWMGPLIEAAIEGGVSGGSGVAEMATPSVKKRRGWRDGAEPLRVIWLTPLRALAADVQKALSAAAEGLGLRWNVELRTGDTSASLRAKQKERLPTCLITTPESLALMLSYADAAAKLGTLRAVVVDEWHELIGSKRGVQTELGLARLRTMNPGLRVWGLSATLGNLGQAMEVLLGSGGGGSGGGRLVRGEGRKAVDVETLIPADIERFPWAGHLGLRQLPGVLEKLEHGGKTTLLFTNTRSQTEIWFQSILRTRPDWIGQVALHHGSLDRGLRARVEEHLKAGTLRCVVCTSSLDLGVDFQPVDQVIQIGSPKGVARLLQRAGRSGHQPGMVSRVVCVPTNAMELVEFAGVRDAIAAGAIESKMPLRGALDVLVQHLVGVAAGGGFVERELLAEVRGTHAFGGITDEEWAWCVGFARGGGAAMGNYPQYARIVEGEDGVFRVASPMVARVYRLGVGTIVSDASMTVALVRGRRLGSIEEGFIARMAPGDVFTFAGRLLKLVRVREMTAYVEPAKRKSGRVPSWQGARMPLSVELSAAVRVKLDEASRGVFESAEMRSVEPLLRLQQRWSGLPGPGEILIELAATREGKHAFVYPLEGRLVHEGLAALLAYRLARLKPRSFSMAASDFGLELSSPDEFDAEDSTWRSALSTERLAEDLLACMNAAELARRQFREIARVAGLIIPGFPGQARSQRHVQASSELFFDVLSEFEPQNLLLDQARREVLERQLEFARLRRTLERIEGLRLLIVKTDRLTPFSFPLWADSLREQLSTEKWTDRVQRMRVVLESAANEPVVRRQRRSTKGALRADD